MPYFRRQARLDAVADLYKAGWTPERIALALTISRATVERLTKPNSPFPSRSPNHVRIAEPSTGMCCQLVDGRYCDAPLGRPGSIYCSKHYDFRWPKGVATR